MSLISDLTSSNKLRLSFSGGNGNPNILVDSLNSSHGNSNTIGSSSGSGTNGNNNNAVSNYNSNTIGGNNNNNSNNGNGNVVMTTNAAAAPKNESKNKRRKLQYTAEKLRRMMLAWAFRRTGKPFKEEKIKRLGREHQEEKLQRYNYLCPRCDVMHFIVQEGYPIRNSIPLCIDNCPNNPLAVKHLDNNLEWVHIKHQEYQKVSSELNSFVSVYVQRDKMSVVENTALTLKIQFSCMNQGEILTLCNQHWIVKVLKRLWFEKIRTSTPAKQGSTQPLNLTYGRFWVELITDVAYLSITAHNTQREYQHIPIDSVIGATVDSSMQIYLSLQSSFESNTSKSGKPRHVSFDLYIKRQYLSRFQAPINVKVTLTKNCSCPSHSEFNDLGNFANVDQENSVSSGDETATVGHSNYECLNAHSNNTLCLYSFKISNTEFQNNFADTNIFRAIQVSSEDHAHQSEKNKSISPQSDSSDGKSSQKNTPEKRKRSNSIDEHIEPSNKRRRHNATHTDEWLSVMPLFISEEEKRPTILPFYPLPPSFSQAAPNNNETRIKIDSKEGINIMPPIPPDPIELRIDTKNGRGILKEPTSDHNNGQYNHLKKFCENYKILHFYEALKKLGCQTPEDILNVLEDENKAHKIWQECGCVSLIDQLAIISTLRLHVKGKQQLQQQPSLTSLPFNNHNNSHVKDEERRDSNGNGASNGNGIDDTMMLNRNGNHHNINTIDEKKLLPLPMHPNQTYQELMEIVDEEKSMDKTYNEKYKEIKEKLQYKQSIAELRKSWQIFLRQWTKWTIEDFHSYLINVEKQIMEKYFASVEDFKHAWYTTQEKEFVGSVLNELDRESLKELGVKDKNDRKVLFQRLTLLRNEKD